MAPLAATEYEALRATIRERGTVRVCTILCGVVAWAGVSALLHLAGPPLGAVVLVPLVVLAASYEISLFIHTGVERVGRYLQVFHEEAAASIGWETVAMQYGGPARSGGPLLTHLFYTVTAVDFLAMLALVDGHPGWAIVTLLAHGAFAYRIVVTARAAATQRADDLERMRALQRSTRMVDAIQKD